MIARLVGILGSHPRSLEAVKSGLIRLRREIDLDGEERQAMGLIANTRADAQIDMLDALLTWLEIGVQEERRFYAVFEEPEVVVEAWTRLRRQGLSEGELREAQWTMTIQPIDRREQLRIRESEIVCDYCERRTWGDFIYITRGGAVSVVCGTCRDHWDDDYQREVGDA